MKYKKSINIYIFVFIVTVSWLVSRYCFQFMLIQGDSMLPAYHSMQLVMLNKFESDYRTGDVIAFRCSGLDSILVKRIVACSGDTIKIQDGKLLVNSEIYQDYFSDLVFEYAGVAETLITLGSGEYFVIGDNISESRDSRYVEVGIVEQETIIGKIAKCFK